MPNTTEAFLTPSEEKEIVAAIRVAEKQTSGEIRVHIEKTSKGAIEDRALEVFSELKMHNTAQRNGVLIYVAVDDRNFAIYGDQGINAVVTETFWDDTIYSIQTHFKNGKFKQGLIDGILKAGEQLQGYFPWDDTDKNELSDSISKG
ncbi:TPM domain-containing protein [Bizionia gelidisalsuginis]|uniref:TPM domain-containing protein n=2 Tax=Bizionia TaxID=283785 RepID=A0A8H2QEK2_9FLAO|nr:MULTISPECIES: TPM domain-containing protein [Bizionia]TYB72538.1 TPM domain-containing protein [Bizionia saleffrena]TYC09615.1 TPM domain-containing protein [Bizionia gelidisalsuginis]